MNQTIIKISGDLNLTHLKPREVYVLSMRMAGMSLKVIGLSMKPMTEEGRGRVADGHLDPERVRQIEAKALRKLHYVFKYYQNTHDTY